MKRYVSLRVPESTKRLAKELSGRAGMQVKDYVEMALELSRKENAEAYKQKKKLESKKISFGFRI